MELSGIGIWSGELRYGDEAEKREAVAELQELGYTAAWIPDVGGDVFGALRELLDATTTLVAATGILNLWMHSPSEVGDGFAALEADFPGRTLLGIGVSHHLLIDNSHPGEYTKPLAKTRAYLDELDEVAPTVPRDRRVLAALGPKMLGLARDRADGAHTYFVPPEHTAAAREILGPDKLLVPEQAFVLHTDPGEARELARRHTGSYLRLPNYTSNLRRFGFGEDDLAGAGSDRLVDTIVPWGDADVLLGRIKEHLDAGADQVAVQVLDFDRRGLPRRQWRELAPALLTV